MMTMPGLDYEIALTRQGYRFVAGLDEAGRGAWAGPVVAAAVILPAAPDVVDRLSGVQDSKVLTPAQRDHFFEVIYQLATGVSVGMASPSMVDNINVLEATRYAMRQALRRLRPVADYLLIDHLALPSVIVPQSSFPKAESISLSVAAASVIAKVTRDRHMVNLNQSYPGYHFDRHKGYGTKAHQTALNELGPSPVHRMSYNPVQRAKAVASA